MEIYFLRHGEAQDKAPGASDADRPLTSLGAAAISNVCKGLKEGVDSFEAIFTSPFLRARQSADIAGNIFGCKDSITATDALIVGSPPSELIAEIKKNSGAGRVLVVGHQPHLGMCVSFLTGESVDEVTIKKGALALVTTESLKENAGDLVWIKEP